MTNSKIALVLLATLFFFIAPSPVEAQGPPLTLTCDPISGSCEVYIMFIDTGGYAQFDVTVNGGLTMILPSIGVGAVITALVPLPGPGGYVVCVKGVGGPLGPGPAACCQFGIAATHDFVRGDANGNGNVNIVDIVTQLVFLFSGGSVPCLDAADANDDGGINIADAVFLIQHVLGAGPVPPAPFPACGPDPTADPLGCHAFPPCP